MILPRNQDLPLGDAAIRYVEPEKSMLVTGEPLVTSLPVGDSKEKLLQALREMGQEKLYSTVSPYFDPPKADGPPKYNHMAKVVRL